LYNSLIRGIQLGMDFGLKKKCEKPRHDTSNYIETSPQRKNIVVVDSKKEPSIHWSTTLPLHKLLPNNK